MRLPPGPPQGRIAQAAAFHRDPLGVLRARQAEFGDIFTLRMGTAGPTVVLASAEAARRLPGTDPAASRAGEARRGLLPMASERSVFGGDGEAHREARRRIASSFSPEAAAARGPAMAALAERHAASWPRRPFRLLPRMRRLADEIFVRLVLGVDDPRAEPLVQAIGAMLWTPGNPPLTIPAPEDGLAGRLVNAAYRRRRARVAAVLEGEIGARRAAGEAGEGVLGRLLADEPAAAPEELVEELLSLTMAAQEPMAAAFTWQARCHGGEPDRFFSDPEGAIEECLRLHPSAAGSLRTLTEPFAIGGGEVPAGATAMVPIPLVQRDPREHEEPDAFRLGRPPGTMLPFGGGGRSCVAEPHARAALAAVLPVVVPRIRPIGRERMVLRATILVPKRSGLVTLA